MKVLNKIFKTSDIRVIDSYTIEHEPISSLDLMERAGTIWAHYFLEQFPQAKEVAVVTGNGNNGGDGYVVARLLQAVGLKVKVYRVEASTLMSEDCEANYRLYLKMGGEVQEITDAFELEIGEHAIVIDALFGSGLNRKVKGVYGEVIRKMNMLKNKIVALDVPSGLLGEDNSLNDRETIVCADYTFTFQFPKLAFLLPENARYVGIWKVLEIGLHPGKIAQMPTCWYYTTAETVAGVLPVATKFAHKGMNGKGLLIAGSEGMMGAAVLAARAAVRSGVGVLYCHVPRRGKEIMQVAVPEGILDTDRSESCLSEVEVEGKYDAIAIGPAIGQGPETVWALQKVLQQWRGVTILDADALNILAEHRESLKLLHEKCILTPHLKEFERLAGKSENDFDRLNKLSIFASRYKVYLVLKGAYSVIATPKGELHFNMSGNPGMAKGGAGDVLTGVLLGLAANGMKMIDVARIGVYAHGLSGDLLAEEYGYRGISSGMLAQGMSKAWKVLESLQDKQRMSNKNE